MKTDSNVALILDIAACRARAAQMRRGMATQPVQRSLSRRVWAMMRLACRVLGLKRRKGLGLALLGAMVAAGAPAHAANGIHINASTTGDCVGINAPTASGQAGSINYTDRSNSCNGNNAATQKDSVLFFRPAGVSGTGATSLSLGGELYVNSGFIRLGDTNSVGMRIGDATTKAVPLALAIGSGADAGSGGTSIGRSSSTAGGSFAVAIGDSAKSSGVYSVAFGANSVSDKDRSVALGAEAKATADGAVALGTKSEATGTNAFATGVGAVASGMDSVAIGTGAKASQGLSVALGSGATTRAARAAPAVVLNGKTYSFDSSNLQGVVSVGSDEKDKPLTRQVINMAAGEISATSFDAVNGAQLFATNDAINELGKVDKTLQAAVDRNTADVAATRASQAAAADSVAQAIGGGTKVDAQGRIVMPEIHLGSLGTGVTQPTTLLGAVGALDSTVKATDRALKDVFDVSMEAEGLATKASRQLEGLGADEKVVDRIDEVKRNALMWDPSQKTYSATHADGAQNRISNVAAGVASTDAVNKGQLDGVGQAAADAQQAAAGAQRTADAAQGAAASAQQASAAARATAADAKAVADAARATAADAQRKADAADAKLVGIGDGETVAGKIDQAVQAAADKSDRNAGEALAAALGGGSTMGADGKASAPAYAVSQVGGDGAVTAPAPATTVGAAVAALDANVLKVNERVSAQGNDLDVLKQDVGNLRDDSLLWDAGAGAFSAAHGGTAPNRIVDVAAGRAETDAVNKGQLDGVAQTATAAQAAAGQAKLAAQGAQDAANGAVQTANEAQAGATAARTTANEAKLTADAAQTAAAQAGDAATGARQAAQTAQADAERAREVAQAAQAAATGAGRAAADAQSTADAAGKTAAAAQQTALEARQQAGQAQAAASSAQNTADANNAKLAGLGEGETVVGRIDAAAKAAADTAAREAGQSLAVALGGGAVVGQDGKPGAPSYAVSQVGPDGAVAPQSQTVNNVGAAVAALDANVLKVNDQVRAQGAALSTLTQDLEGLRDDSLLWDQGAGAFSATRGGEQANRIVNLAAGQATTDAVNKGQLDEAVAQLRAQGAGLLQEADGQLQVGRGADATVVNLAGAAPQRDAQGNPVMDADGNVVTAATDRTLTGVADGKAANDAVNKGQLDTVAGTATAASEAAASAQQTANAAQADAENARQVATAAQATARNAEQSAGEAQATAMQARQSADAASAKLAGIGEGETVAGRIDQAAKAAADTAVQDAGKALAAALGGGAGMDSDGNPVAPAYVLNQIGPDGSVKAGGQTKNNVGDALAAVDANVLAVNERVATQGRDVTRLTQGVSDLRNDSLLWDQDAGAFSAAHGADAPNRIANVAAGQAATDAVNKGQLDTVSQAADVARADARQARDSADAAQGTAVQAQQSAQSAQGAAAAAQGAADAANAKLAGIGEGETVAGRIGDATRAANQALADALGGGAGVAVDGTVQGPAFAVTAVGPDGRGQASSQGNVA
ncbi:hypothetical protein, partial [Achromobacter xylosoxidans]|uniref:hypothetical protein n=1 Tax=Alcaligenes xylosoxydans xylosoxydans TaxID=85698 RepID=UPI001300F2B8